MKHTNKPVLTALLENDKTVTDHQREIILATLENKPTPLTPVLLKQSDVADLLSVSRQTVWTLTKRGVLNPVKLSSGLSRYRRDEVLAIADGKKEVAA